MLQLCALSHLFLMKMGKNSIPPKVVQLITFILTMLQNGSVAMILMDIKKTFDPISLLIQSQSLSTKSTKSTKSEMSDNRVFNYNGN